jgi:sensor histidine kinase YesM
VDFISLKTDNELFPVISIQSEQKEYLFRYGINPAWPYFYLYYPGIYLSILVFALIVKNIQKSQSKKKYEIEKKISELQLALIRNQLDPHFTFNVINSIIYSVEYSENKQVGEQLRQFASLYRNMLLSASSTRRSIAEELDFCSNYLLLQKMRFKESFNYNICVSEDIDRNYLIPKFLIQIHAENAIKHGLSSIEKEGKLDIDLRKENSVLLIEITDNGIGRVKSAGLDKLSTGKGLETMDELYSIYNKYYNEKVSSQITDLHNQEGKPIGTKVSIRNKMKKTDSGIRHISVVLNSFIFVSVGE